MLEILHTTRSSPFTVNRVRFVLTSMLTDINRLARIQEIEILDPTGVNLGRLPGCTYNASSVHPPNAQGVTYTADKAFDGLIGSGGARTYWCSNVGNAPNPDGSCWIEVTFPNVVEVKSIRIASGFNDSSLKGDITSMIIEGYLGETKVVSLEVSGFNSTTRPPTYDKVY